MITNSNLVCLVEGNRDIDFINEIVKQEYIRQGKFSKVVPYKYKNVKKEENIKFIDSMLSIGWKILCFADINGSRCINRRKSKLKRDDIGDVPNDVIVIIRKEIESWYLAGLDEHCCRKFGIRNLGRTDTITKNECHQIIGRSKYKLREACMQEILKNFNFVVARGKNKTFFYFYQKHLS